MDVTMFALMAGVFVLAVVASYVIYKEAMSE